LGAPICIEICRPKLFVGIGLAFDPALLVFPDRLEPGSGLRQLGVESGLQVLQFDMLVSGERLPGPLAVTGGRLRVVDHAGGHQIGSSGEPACPVRGVSSLEQQVAEYLQQDGRAEIAEPHHALHPFQGALPCVAGEYEHQGVGSFGVVRIASRMGHPLVEELLEVDPRQVLEMVVDRLVRLRVFDGVAGMVSFVSGDEPSESATDGSPVGSALEEVFGQIFLVAFAAEMGLRIDDQRAVDELDAPFVLAGV
jgi:hypothetical protein